MTPFKIYRPIKPMFISQKWGNIPIDPKTGESVYKPFGFTMHNGADLAPINNPKFPLNCPVEGFRVHQIRNIPSGCGLEISLLSKERIQVGDKLCYAYMVFMHNHKILVPAGYEPALGELIAIGDNSGFSTGAHSHMGLYRVDFDGKRITWLDKNDANDSYDPHEFMQDRYVQEVTASSTLVTNYFRYLKWLTGL